MAKTTSGESSRATARETIGKTTHTAATRTISNNVMLAILMASTFSASISQSMMNIALPHVADTFSVTLSQANWIVVGYTIVAATSITMAAALLKRLGLRKIFALGCGALALGSLLGIFSLNFPMLVIGRLIQAMSTGFLYPVVTSVIIVIVPVERRGTILALNTAIIGVGQAAGPLVSGLLLTYFNLHVMFIVPTVLGVLLVIGGIILLHDVEERGRIPIDIPSVILSFVGLAAFMYGLGEVTHHTLPAVIGIGIGAVVIALFVRRQLKIETPLLNLKPLQNPRFTLGVTLVMLAMMATASMSLLLPLFYEGTAGDTAFVAGLLIAGPLLLYGILSVLGGRIFDKHGLWPLVPIGFALVLIGFVGIFITSDHVLVPAVTLISFMVYGGVGFIVAPSKTKALNELSRDLYSHGAAINSTFVQVANAIGASLYVGVLSADVVREMANHVAKADAYAVGFAHTLIISIVLACIALVVAIIYSWKMRNRIHSK